MGCKSRRRPSQTPKRNKSSMAMIKRHKLRKLNSMNTPDVTTNPSFPSSSANTNLHKLYVTANFDGTIQKIETMQSKHASVAMEAVSTHNSQVCIPASANRQAHTAGLPVDLGLLTVLPVPSAVNDGVHMHTNDLCIESTGSSQDKPTTSMHMHTDGSAIKRNHPAGIVNTVPPVRHSTRIKKCRIDNMNMKVSGTEVLGDVSIRKSNLECNNFNIRNNPQNDTTIPKIISVQSYANNLSLPVQATPIHTYLHTSIKKYHILKLKTPKLVKPSQSSDSCSEQIRLLDTLVEQTSEALASSAPKSTSATTTPQRADGSRLSRLCRVCAYEGEDMTMIYGFQGSRRKLADLIDKHLPISVSPEDRLPLQVCADCVRLLQVWHNLSWRCLQADSKLRRQLDVQDQLLLNQTEISNSSTSDQSHCIDLFEDDSRLDQGKSKLVSKKPTYFYKVVKPKAGKASEKDVLVASVAQGSKRAPTSEPCVSESIAGSSTNTGAKGVVQPAAAAAAAQTKQSGANTLVPSPTQPATKSSVDTEEPLDIIPPDPPYFCKLCDHPDCSFTTLVFLKKHIQSIHKLFMCDYCLDTFESIEMTASHTKYRHLFKCAICNQGGFLGKKGLYKHCISVHDVRVLKSVPQPIPITFAPKLSCEICKEKLYNKAAIKKHYLYVHRKHICETCSECFDCHKKLKEHEEEIHISKCVICDHETRSQGKYFTHVTLFHKNVDTDKLKIKTKSSNLYQCKLCKKELSSKYNMNRHHYWFHRKYSCEHCLMAFSSLKIEEKHYHEIHSKCCSECGEKFNNCESLTQHLKLKHPNLKWALCEACGKYFNDRDTLMLHKKSHTDNFTRKKRGPIDGLCDICGKTMNPKHVEKHKLSKHGSDQEAKTNTQCTICDRKFVSCGGLTLHMTRIHFGFTRKQNFKCNICNNYYETMEKFDRHTERHSKYKCELCDMQYMFKHYLEDHVKVVHSNKCVYKCSICERVLLSESDSSFHLGFHSQEQISQVQEVFTQIDVLHCGLCDKFYSTKDKLQTHMKRCHIRGKKIITHVRQKPTGRRPYLARVD